MTDANGARRQTKRQEKRADTRQEERQEGREDKREDIRPDICVIGAGAGGIAAASAAASFGVSVALIENGTLNDETRGPLPSKALLAAAGRVHALRNGEPFGVKASRFGIDFDAIRAHMRATAAAAAPLASRERLRGLGVRLFEGEGRFVDATTVAVDGFDVKARRYIIATGSTPALPDIPGLADVPYLTADTLCELGECPRHLIVIGVEAAGLELAQAFRRLGAEVTVLATGRPFEDVDPECADVVLDALAGEGISLRQEIAIRRVRRVLARIEVDIADAVDPAAPSETIGGSHLLIAAGRRPDIDTLDLDMAGIRHGPRGIAVDRGLRTSNKQVYALGDAIGGPALRHLAQNQAALVVRNALFRTPVDADGHAVPTAIFTDPELAHVGRSETAARAAGAIRVLRASYRDNDRARAAGTTAGHIKIVTDRKGAILGVTIAGAGAAESIGGWTLAINQKVNIEALAGVVVPYPSYADVGKRAAMTYFTRGLTNPVLRRIISWLRRFG